MTFTSGENLASSNVHSLYLAYRGGHDRLLVRYYIAVGRPHTEITQRQPSLFIINTVGQYGNFKMLENYVKDQGINDYKLIHRKLSPFSHNTNSPVIPRPLAAG